MERKIFDDAYDLAKYVCKKQDNVDSVSIVCDYDYAVWILSDLVKDDLNLTHVSLTDKEYDGYDKEYLITVSDDDIYCEKMYHSTSEGYKKDGYLRHECSICLIHQDCNSKIIDKIDADKMYEIAFADELDEDDVNDSEDSMFDRTVTVFSDDDDNTIGFMLVQRPNDYSAFAFSVLSRDDEYIDHIADILDIDLEDK